MRNSFMANEMEGDIDPSTIWVLPPDAEVNKEL